jgi:hypothetical protein
MTICFGKGAAKRTDPSVESQSTSDPFVESDENSSFGDTTAVLKFHGENDDAKRQVDKMTSTMEDPYKESNKCNLL